MFTLEPSISESKEEPFLLCRFGTLRWGCRSSTGIIQFSSVQSLSHVQLFATPWTTACQASLSITNSWSLPKLMSIELVMPSSHLILCRSLLLPSIFPSSRVFSNESALLSQMSQLKWVYPNGDGRYLAYLIKSVASLLASKDSLTVIQSPLEVK